MLDTDQASAAAAHVVGREEVERAVVYVTDRGFLVPTLVSALQVKEQVGDIADVLIALTEFEDEELAPLFALGGRLGIKFFTVPEADIAGTTFREAHVPVACMARLMLPEVLDRKYRYVTYLDGDTQIPGDIRPLICFNSPPGKVTAAPDIQWVGLATSKRFPSGYFKGLGIKNHNSYFNSGVMSLERETLDLKFREALNFFRDNSEACLYHDQSALNAAFAGNCLRMSPRYNFITDYSYLGLLDFANPVVVHFTGPAKPWLHDGFPFWGRFLDSYAEIVDRHPELQPYAKNFVSEDSAKIAAAAERTRRRYRMMWPIAAYRRLRFRAGVGKGFLL